MDSVLESSRRELGAAGIPLLAVVCGVVGAGMALQWKGFSSSILQEKEELFKHFNHLLSFDYTYLLTL